METNKMLGYVKNVLENIPLDWLHLTTHRLDIYNEELAKTQFLEQLEVLYKNNASEPLELNELPTAFDYIRLGHPLSCILEWMLAKMYGLQAESVISFSSKTAPLLAILRKNSLDNKNTQILYTDGLPDTFDATIVRDVYGYAFDIKKIQNTDTHFEFKGSTVLFSENNDPLAIKLDPSIDFYVNSYASYGSIAMVNGQQNKDYISEIQHVRRRETIAMTPSNCFTFLKIIVASPALDGIEKSRFEKNKTNVVSNISAITGTTNDALVGSSGLSVQYAIMMGLVHHAIENHSGKAIKFVVPPNCYGGTNDQARRVAAAIKNVEVVDLPVDDGNDMAQSVDLVLDRIAHENAIPYIIAEIPTNPRVEVPNLIKLKEALSKKRLTETGNTAVDPVFILDQTFCPNVHFLGEGEILSTVRAISYASGSKFPSGGRCTAGYCVSNTKAEGLMKKIALHLNLCDNEATPLQYQILAEQLPSMKQRIQDAYENTLEFVTFIKKSLPEAKINFVPKDIAEMGFTPSVFSLDLPTKGTNDQEKESYKRKLNHRLINLMITKIPHESKYCVSYGQLKGCYWTIPATSTQGTTKEGDKDYIARVAISPDLDLERHKKVFLEFVESI